MFEARVLSVNVGLAAPNPAKPDANGTGIGKRPADVPVQVRAPGSKRDGLGSGLVGDHIGDRKNHGGDDQAVYAYAREDLDHWAAELGRDLAGGMFGENLTTDGLEVTGALIGERWRIGDDVVLQVTCPRIPCTTFSARMDEPGWIKTFTRAARPGAYLRVIESGEITGGDRVTVAHRPDHDVTIGVAFRALTLEPELLPRLLIADDFPAEEREIVRRRVERTPDR